VASLAQLAEQTVLTIPSIYDSRISPSAPPALQALAGGSYSENATCSQTVVTTTGGQVVTYYAKSTQWNNELYASCIAPSRGESLLVESWIRGSAEGPSCGSGTVDVLDVQNLSYPFGLAFTEYNDHSKWCVGRDLVCASDINRMTTQYQRGGSAFCFHDQVLATALRTAVVSTDSCSTKKN